MRKLFSVILFLLIHLVIAQKQYSFDFVEKPLNEIVKELSSKHKLKFSFNPKELKKHTLTRKIRAKSDADLVSQIFKDFPFQIQLTDGIYLVIPKKIEPKPVAVRGQVLDQGSGEPLAFAHIQSDQKGTISNQSGRFSLPPTKDTVTLTVSYIGYRPLKLRVPPNQEIIQLNLEQNPTELQEVVLNSSEMKGLSNQPSFFSLNPKQFNALPALGEPDVFKSIQLLPGVRATDETSSGLTIRGSLPSQNLVLMDGFTLYHLDHFFGIYSTLNPNVINNVSVYKGGFGAEYGGRISSVIDVASKSGVPEKIQGGAGLNMLSANGFLQLPLGNRTSLLIGARQSFSAIINSNLYADFLSSNRKTYLESIDSDIASLDLSPALDFYDINGKLQHRFSDKTVVDVNFYASNDNYVGDFIEGDDFSSFNVIDEADWSNIGLSMNLKSQLKPTWFGEFIVSGSEFREEERLAINETIFEDVSFNTDSIRANSTIEYFDYITNSSINDFTVKTNHEIDIDQKNLINAGLEYNAVQTTYNSDQLYFVDFNENVTFGDSLDIQSSILGLYTSHQFSSNEFTTNLGLRANYYEAADKWFIEPRFTIQFDVTDKLSLKGAATYHHQFVSQNAFSPFQSTDQFYWVLADDDVIPVQKSAHFILGGSYTLRNWSIDLEYYRKNTTGIIENQFLVLTPGNLTIVNLEDINLSGENTSEGLDFFLKYRDEKFTSWVSYSLGASENQFWYISQNDPYPSVQDQRHEINFTSILKLGKWELSSLVLFGSGRPYTPPNPAFESGVNEEIYDFSRINGARLPAYHRVDLASKYSFKLGKSECEMGVTLFNVFNTRNIKSRRYAIRYIFSESVEANSGENVEDEARLVVLDTPLLGFTPNFFLNIRF